MTDDLFDAFESAEEIYAYLHQECGPEALQQVLNQLLDAGELDQESLEQDATKLAEVGLEAASEMLVQAAKEAPPYAAFLMEQHGNCFKSNLKSRIAYAIRHERLGPNSLEYLRQVAGRDILSFAGIEPEAQA